MRLDGSGGEPFDIPGGTAPVTMTTLRSDRATRSLTALVTFPAGWSRPAAGWYEAAEEMLVLDGELTMSGVTHSGGDWAYLPAGYHRTGTATPAGATCLARFSGPARWVEGDDPPATFDVLAASTDATGPWHDPSPIGPGRLLRAGDDAFTWVLPAVRGTAPCALELTDMGARAWAWIPQGADLPLTHGPCLLRVVR